MTDILFSAHSGLRYLVLLAGLAAIVVGVLGWRQPVSDASRRVELILASVFVGLLDLQALLGIVLLLRWPFYAQLIGHIVMMLGAVAVAHIGAARAKRRTTPSEAAQLRALTFGGALLLVVAGILAIQRAII